MKLANAFFFSIALFLPFFVFAENPSVSSFSASPSSFPSGYPVSFSWTIYNAGGYSFFVPCVSGIKITYTTGAAFSCGIPLVSSAKTSDSITLQIHNVSGSQKTVTARITPKDAGGSDVADAAKEASIAVSTLADPITNFSASATGVSAETPVTISWTAQAVGGVNLSIECKTDIKASTPGYTKELFIPCGIPIFASDLAPSGSLTMNFSNSSQSTLPYALTLLPAIEPGSYDGTHSKSLTLNIGSGILSDPEVLSFSSSSGRVKSGGEFIVSWSTKNAAGVNLVISCLDYITATSSSDMSLKLPCGKNAFSEDWPKSGERVLAFANDANTSVDVTISLVPERLQGGYDATRQKQIKITVEKAAASTPTTPVSLPLPPAPQSTPPPPAPLLPPSAVLPPAPPPPAILPISSQKSQKESPIPSQKPSSIVPVPAVFSESRYPKIRLTQTLKKESRGEEVTLLQEFLASDNALSPEKLITGYFGSLTEHAVQRFQEKYDIASSEKNRGEYGIAGEKTRAKIHALGGTKIPIHEGGEEKKQKDTMQFTDESELKPHIPVFPENQKQNSGVIGEVRSFFSYVIWLVTDFLLQTD